MPSSSSRPVPPSEELQELGKYLHCGMELFELHASFSTSSSHFIGSLLNLRCAQPTSAGGFAMIHREDEIHSSLRTAFDSLHHNTQARPERAVLGFRGPRLRELPSSTAEP